MKISYIIRTDGACDFYRVEQPMNYAKKLFPEHQFAKISEAQIKVAVENDDNKTLERLMSADIVILPRLWGISPLRCIRELNPKAKIVLEYDDNLFEVSPMSPHYVDHGVEEVDIVLPGDKAPKPLWKNLMNIDIPKNILRRDETIQAMGEADLITTTTPILAGILGQHNKNVAVLPNLIDRSLWQKLPLRPHRGFRMGWFGGSSHYEDWLLLQEVLPRLMAENPDITLVLMGTKFDGTLKGIPKERIEFHGWVPTAAYPYKAAILDLDLALIPLQDTAFNASKSAIKFLEMSSLAVPSVVSFVSPYKELATEDNAMWIEDNSPEAWYKGISEMVHNPLLRSKTALEAELMIRRDHDIQKKAHLWIRAYENLLKGVTHGGTDSPHVSNARS
jgi:glycosyltransferase involved in cell wall biosynthesis